MAEYNIGYSPKGEASVAFQKVFATFAGTGGGQAIVTSFNSLQKSCAGLRATRKIATNPNAVAITGDGKRAILKFVCADKTTVTVKFEHFDPTKSVDALGAALVGLVKNKAGSASTACVKAITETVQYV